MFHIIQSNNTDRLVGHLIDFYKKNNSSDELAHLIFTPFTVIVPSMVLGDWLIKTVASRVGISTLFTAQFWGKYQWDMMKTVLALDAQIHFDDALSVPEVAVLSASIMRWRIFGFVMSEFKKDGTLMDDAAHPLYFLIKPLYDDAKNLPEHRLWQACDELSRLYVRYLTHRPEWLSDWANGVSLADTVKQMMSDKERLDKAFGAIQLNDDDKTDDNDTPKWLVEHYLDLERLLGYLWQQLFGETYRYRLALEERFWQVLSGKRDSTAHHDGDDPLSVRAIQELPKALYLFIVQQIPRAELDFLKQLSLYLDVVLLHFNPSMMFWADIVDRQWLQTQKIIRPHMVYLKDYGHGLLSRLGKESRDTFAMLADLSGGDSHGKWQVRWQDDFDESVSDDNTLPNLLQGLKTDILMLDHDKDAHHQAGGQVMTTLLSDDWADDVFDDTLMQKVRPKTPLRLDTKMDMGSLSIHACHSLKRQLELSRLMIAKYLNDNPQRGLADVVVLLPDIASAQDLIRSVFPDGKGADGLTLPIKITGTPDKRIDELIKAIMGFYTLLGEPTSRFYADEVNEWLLTPALYESFGLSFDEMRRGVDLLRRAGFRRGFDERHRSKTLHVDDSDYRYTFSHALDRLVLGLLTPTKTPSRALHPFVWRAGVFGEASLPLMGVSLNDQNIIHALSAIHAGLSNNRNQLTAVDGVERLLNHIEHEVINRYFGHWHDSVGMRAIFNAKNAMMSSLRANRYYHHLSVADEQVGNMVNTDEIYLPMKLVIESLSEMVKAQAISAEPSEVITFARFGTVRSIPFGLTVMLEMNLTSFPRQDRAVRLDLMRAGVRRLGDRYNEDDDNGAFLDALLCTKDACLIFYKGLSSDGKTKLLPASVVSELIEFLKTEAHWQDDGMGEWQEGTTMQAKTDKPNDEMTTLINELMPALVEDYLISYHEPTFFDKAVYYRHDKTDCDDDLASQLNAHLNTRLTALKYRQKQALPPPQLWQDIRQTLDAQTITPKPPSLIMDDTAVLDLATRLEQSFVCPDDKALARHIKTMYEHYGLTLPTNMHAEELIGPFKNMGKTYLHDKVKIDKAYDPDGQNEPLTLDALGNYHINELFIRGAGFGLFDEMQTAHESFYHLLDAMNQTNDHHHNDAIFAMQALYYGDRLPAGQLRLSMPDEYFAQLKDELGEFNAMLDNLKSDECYVKALNDVLANDHLSTTLSLTCEQSVLLVCDDICIDITANLPTDDTSWRAILPNTARAEHLFRFFVHHLLWQMTADDDKCSLWQYRKAGHDTDFAGRKFALSGICTTVAKAYVLNLILLAQLAKQKLIVMTHRDGLAYLAHCQKGDTKPTSKLFGKWMGTQNHDNIYDNDSRHEIWQLVLQGDDPYKALMTYLPLALPLYQLMFDSLIAID